MPRIVKAAADRKSEIVDCAQALFFEKGYEATTIADILAHTKLSKGAFYHHFTAKEDLLDALTERITQAYIAVAQDVLEDQSLDALARLNRFFKRGSQWKAETAPSFAPIYAAVLKPENAVLYQRMVQVAMKALAPVLAHIVEQGNREGLFDAPDPDVVAEMLLHLANARQAFMVACVEQAAHGELDAAADALETRMRVEQTIFGRILGLEDGSIQFVQPGFARAMLAAMKKPARRPAKAAA